MQPPRRGGPGAGSPGEARPVEPAHRPRRRRRRLRARRAARGAAAPARGAGPLRRRGVRTAGESAPGPRTPVLPGTLRLREGQGGRRRAGSGGGGSPAAPLRASPGELPGLPSPATPPVRSAAGAGAGPGGTPGIPGCSGRTAAPGALTAPTRAAPTPPLPSPGSPRLGRSCPRCRAWRGVPRQEPPDPPPWGPREPHPARGGSPSPASCGPGSPFPDHRSRLIWIRFSRSQPRAQPSAYFWQPWGDGSPSVRVELAVPVPSGCSELRSLRGAARSGVLGVGSVRARPWGVLVQLHRVTAPSGGQRELCPCPIPALAASHHSPNSPRDGSAGDPGPKEPLPQVGRRTWDNCTPGCLCRAALCRAVTVKRCCRAVLSCHRHRL